jgi:tyrosyl-tRNA synthetase
MTLSEELTWRGFVNQTTLTDISELDDKKRSFYFGVDPSSDSMTIGNLAAAMMVRHFIDHGHKAYLLVGGATGIIGDPDGKRDERNLKTLDEIDKNKAGISAQYQRIFAGKEFTVVDNYDWFKNINYLDFLREVGKHMSMTQMLDRDFVQARIGEGGTGISYAEFSYSLIQGYDFLHLYRENGVTLQLCGGDQWGNSVTGVGLIRKLEGAETHVYSTPLVINKATGKKFGKSEDGAVWLDELKTSVYKFYQFWLNVDDEGVIDYTKVYTLLSKDEVTELARNHFDNPGARIAQKKLAFEVTSLVHGTERAEAAKRATELLFGSSVFDANDSGLVSLLRHELPSFEPGDTISSYLVDSGATTSKSEARRLIAAGAISINGTKVTEDTQIETACLIKKGKNVFILIA